MRDLQGRDRLFNSCERTVIFFVGIVGGNQVGNIALDKKLAFIGVKNSDHVDPTVTRARNHHAGMLAIFHRAAIPSLIFGITGRLPAMMAFCQISSNGRAYFILGTSTY